MAKTPEKTVHNQTPGPSGASEVDNFIKTVRQNIPAASPNDQTGRLIFAMDATMSREATWQQAIEIQASMFDEAARIGGLDIQLVYFRGFSECRASKWASDATKLARLMASVRCQGGYTQIARVLSHIKRESQKQQVDAVVFVGDCIEEEIDRVCNTAGEVGLAGVPVFLFQEGHNLKATQAFKEIARLTKGAHCRFSPGSAGELRKLLQAVAVYATGGRKALTDFSRANPASTDLLEQLK